MAEPVKGETAAGTYIMGVSDNDEDWLAVHDLLLDEWLAIYEKVKAKAGSMRADQIFPVGINAIGLTCMHNCGCEEDPDYLLGVPGDQPGSRHKGYRAVVLCEPCLRGQATPLHELAERDEPVQ